MTDAASSCWPGTLRRYLVLSIVLHLVWEALQLPLFTIAADPWRKQAFAVFHCTLGDGMIAGLSLLAALAVMAPAKWPEEGLRGTWLMTLALSVGYTVFSEWLNVSVRGSWAYGPLMPTLPVLGTGLAPLLQWVVVPTLALALATRRVTWSQNAS